MTPEEKAKELVERFMPICYVPWMGGDNEATQEYAAKEAATICVDELIKHTHSCDIFELYDHSYEYWEQVKQSIQAL